MPDRQDWPGRLSALGDWLAAEKPRGMRRARMVVSAHEARFCLVPWPRRHLTAAQQQAWVRLHFEALHGDMHGWQTAQDAGAYGQACLACALPEELVAHWHGLCRRHRLSDALLQPYAVRVWNHWRHHARPGQLWGIAEADRIVWARQGTHGWAVVRCVKARADAGDLPALAMQELQLQGAEAVPCAVLHAPGQGGGAVAGPDGPPTRWLALTHGEEAAGIAMARLAAQA